MKDGWITIAQFIIYVAVFLISAGIAYASLQSRIIGVEDKINVIRNDHDVLISLLPKLQAIEQDISEIKTDVREIKNSVDKHILKNN